MLTSRQAGAWLVHQQAPAARAAEPRHLANAHCTAFSARARDMRSKRGTEGRSPRRGTLAPLLGQLAPAPPQPQAVLPVAARGSLIS